LYYDAGGLQADRDAPAAAEGPLRRVASEGDLLPASPFVSQVSQATGETMRLQEGLVASKSWIKSALD